MIKICEECGIEFTVKKSFQKYCSEECRGKAYQKEYHNNNAVNWRICPSCGKVFWPSRKDKIYCSRKCKTKVVDRRCKDNLRFGGNRTFALEADHYECALCGSTENLAVHHRDKSGSTDNPNNEVTNLITLCSSCHTKVHNPRLDTTPHVIKTCEYCGEEMRVSQARIDAGRGKYCSEECANKAKEKKIPKICAHCGKEFYITPSRAKRGKVKYCSMECRKAAGYAWTNNN